VGVTQAVREPLCQPFVVLFGGWVLASVDSNDVARSYRLTGWAVASVGRTKLSQGSSDKPGLTRTLQTVDSPTEASSSLWRALLAVGSISLLLR